MTLYNNITNAFGNTPLIKINNYEGYGNIFAKLEFYNPSSSIKDRLAIAMIDEAEKSGLLKKGGAVVESSSGNTGIAIAMVASARGYNAIIVMPENVSQERKDLIRAYGAEVIITEKNEGMKGAYNKATIISKERDAIFLEQFKNIAGPNIHYNTTGKEILEDLNGRVDYFISGIGTGGTITGVGRRLKEHDKMIKVIGVEPASSPIFTKGESGSHKISGIGPNFIPDIYNKKYIDEIFSINDDEAWESSRWLGKNTGILAGISSGATYNAAVKLSKSKECKNKNLVVIFASNGERYISTEIYKI